MQKAVLYLVVGTTISFIITYFVWGTEGFALDLYRAIAFGMGWGMAYFVDHPEWSLAKKLGISFVGIAFLVLLGLVFFDLEQALPSIIKFSTVFVAYYLFASLRATKSLRK